MRVSRAGRRDKARRWWAVQQRVAARLGGWQVSGMIRRMLRFGPVGGLELVLAGGAAYFAWEHEQGRHAQAHMLCPICWLNKIAPAAEPPDAAPAASQE
jgi:hypothetical protein